MGNSIGKIFSLTTFGESHGKSMGGVIDGCPSGLTLDFKYINYQLKRRRPGFSKVSSDRVELDEVEFLSGVYKGKTTGSPIGFLVKNRDYNSSDYSNLKNIFRPSHADYTHFKKYRFNDYRGGGRSSARETVCRVVAGSIAQLFLKKLNIKIQAYVSSIGNISLKNSYSELDLTEIDKNMVRCPDIIIAKKMISEIERVKSEGDTIGGKINVIATGLFAGLGEPVFDKLHADLGKALLSINSVHSFKYGFSNLNISECKGSEVNDVLVDLEGRTKTNFSGGIQGGISNGNDIYCEIEFKPVSSIKKQQKSITKKGDSVDFKIEGRHDSCVVPRAVPIVESMVAIILFDHYLRSLKDKII